MATVNSGSAPVNARLTCRCKACRSCATLPAPFRYGKTYRKRRRRK